MNELQLYHWIATGGITALLTILWWWVRGVSDDMKQKVSRDEFKAYLDETANARKELRDAIIKIFEKAELHEKLDSSRFELLTKDFNGGMRDIRDLLYTSKLVILREMATKQDKAK